MECQPCRKQNRLSSAKYWCTECDEALCHSCKSQHKSFKVSGNHNVIELQQDFALPVDSQNESVGVGNDEWIMCHEHRDKSLEYFYFACTKNGTNTLRGDTNKDGVESGSSTIELESQASNWELSHPVSKLLLTSPVTSAPSLTLTCSTSLPAESLHNSPVGFLSSSFITQTTHLPFAADSGNGSQFYFYLMKSFRIEKRNKDIAISDAKLMPNKYHIAIAETSNPSPGNRILCIFVFNPKRRVYKISFLFLPNDDFTLDYSGSDPTSYSAKVFGETYTAECYARSGPFYAMRRKINGTYSYLCAKDAMFNREHDLLVYYRMSWVHFPGNPTICDICNGKGYWPPLLLKVLRSVMAARGCTMSLYRQQSNGRCESINGTLKSMLEKLCTESAEEWNEFVPYAFFAYREVPHEETVFSLFELLYGWPVRGPIAILRGLFTGEDEIHCSVIEHVITIRDRLADVSEIVKVNLSHRKGKIKTWYYKRTRFRAFEPKDELLLFLPAAASKNNADALSRI
ncbi:unnamed protein product [Mytilus coruscus]|uniref:B box-type domain-containing protein n=1 Tax=Mytilus coruscus TaxID=42192 RepID=A0A6J8B7Q0_MYTCO|nr:unnamed protein product [Mytilus coruscus]